MWEFSGVQLLCHQILLSELLCCSYRGTTVCGHICWQQHKAGVQPIVDARVGDGSCGWADCKQSLQVCSASLLAQIGQCLSKLSQWRVMRSLLCCCDCDAVLGSAVVLWSFTHAWEEVYDEEPDWDDQRELSPSHHYCRYTPIKHNPLYCSVVLM